VTHLLLIAAAALRELAGRNVRDAATVLAGLVAAPLLRRRRDGRHRLRNA
jgi:MYXO-CTERM domain-containing protein